MAKVVYRFIICCILYTICSLSCQINALPSPNVVTETSQVMTSDLNGVDITSTPTDVIGRPRSSVGTGRQGALLAALGTAIAPFLIGLITPLITQLASMVSSAVLGKLQVAAVPNNTALSHYEAYMINMPDQPGPYLFLTTTRDPEKDDQLPLQASPFGRFPALRKTPKISQHLGTVNINTSLDGLKDSARQSSREMRIPSSTLTNTKE